MTFVPDLWALRGSPNDPPLRKSEIESEKGGGLPGSDQVQAEGAPPGEKRYLRISVAFEPAGIRSASRQIRGSTLRARGLLSAPPRL